ncbi:Crp/Fnr family transcriptional regulator [Bacillus sp. S3]|uniref:Crp/Fnr family transcriptional regulator n=1 Tax=Bacillus sp. S3 TaxID=486398 RepID=UPI00118AFFE4|nr:Crp/Fnr family transcriptional regulator [Bacillus sp. S3]QCJ41832.1 Crp/Fnr family transcriptional regulator [Bacillus sp. S3]
MNQCRHQPLNGTSVKKLCISLVPIFNHLQDDDMFEIAKTSQSKTYQKGEIIFEAGDASDYLYIVHKGQVKIYRLTESGKDQLIRIMCPGDFMGELSLFTKESLTNYAEAMKQTELCVIHKSDLRKILLTKPEISLKILEVFSSRLDEAEKAIERFHTQDAEKRIASYLIDLVHKTHPKLSPENKAIEITLPMSKRDLASYIGMTQETLSRRLSSFQELGWIEQTGQRKLNIMELKMVMKIATE